MQKITFAVNKGVTVTDLISQEKMYFHNALTLKENIVSAIIIKNKQTGSLTLTDRRDQVKEQYDIKEGVSTITGRQFAYSEKANFHAKYSQQ